MRRLVTGLVLAALVALAVVAGIDALRPEGRPGRFVPRDEALERMRVTAELRRAGIAGVLTYSDERCRLRAVSLPDLTRHPVAEGRACSFTYSAGNYAVGSAVQHPTDPSLAARCRNRVVEVRFRTSFARAPGCAPSWKPNGILTAVRDGEVVELHLFPERPRLVPRVVLSRSELGDAFRRLTLEARGVAVERLVWISDSRFAAVVRRLFVADVLVIFEGRHVVAPPATKGRELIDLRASPRGTFVAARTSGSDLLVIDRRGSLAPLPTSANGHAITWSPDERWAAVATSNGVDLFSADTGLPPVIRLPIVARDLIWR